MDGSAERDGKDGNVLPHAVLDGLRQCHRNRRGRGLRPQSRGIRREHGSEQAQRILPAHDACHAKLNQEQQHVQDEDNENHLQEHRNDGKYLSAHGHIQKDAEDMDGQ